jgi:hypothetical protein
VSRTNLLYALWLSPPCSVPPGALCADPSVLRGVLSADGELSTAAPDAPAPSPPAPVNEVEVLVALSPWVVLLGYEALEAWLPGCAFWVSYTCLWQQHERLERTVVPPEGSARKAHRIGESYSTHLILHVLAVVVYRHSLGTGRWISLGNVVGHLGR